MIQKLDKETGVNTMNIYGYGQNKECNIKWFRNTKIPGLVTSSWESPSFNYILQAHDQSV